MHQNKPKRNENIATISALIGNAPKPRFIKNSFCKSCEQEIKIFETEIAGGPKKGEKYRYERGCKCEDYKLARQALEQRQKLKQERIQRIFNQNSLIPPKLKKATFEGYKPQNKSQEKAKQALINFVNEFDRDESKNLIITGDYGLGKSHLCVASIKALMARGYTAIFCAVPTLMAKIRHTFTGKSEHTEQELLQYLETVDILVLDDLGAESATDWRNEILLQIISARAGLHTIYTTNLGSKGLEDHLQSRNFSKILEDTEIIKVTGKDQRIKRK